MTQPADNSVHPYRAVWDTRDMSVWIDALAPDVVVYSPVLRNPLVGREPATELFSVLFACLRDFEIVHEMANDDADVFFWSAVAGGRRIEVADLIRFDASGNLCEIRVLIRPLVDIGACAAVVGPPLARKRGRTRGLLVRLLTIPLRLVLTLADVIASRLLQGTNRGDRRDAASVHNQARPLEDAT